MKTINKILTLVVFLLCGYVSATAQPVNYYPNQADTIVLGDCVYRYRTEYGFIELYNNDSKYVGVEQMYKDGSPLGLEADSGKTRYVENMGTMGRDCYAIVRDSFTEEDKRLVNNSQWQGLIIGLYVSSDTGVVEDVCFNFHSQSNYVAISPVVFRRIERLIKEKIHFTPSAYGRTVNYLFTNWTQKFKPATAAPPPTVNRDIHTGSLELEMP